MTNGGNFGQRVLVALLPIAISALVGHAVYVLAWGVKVDARMAHAEQTIIELKAQATTLDARLAATQSQLETLIALLRARERSERRGSEGVRQPD